MRISAPLTLSLLSALATSAPTTPHSPVAMLAPRAPDTSLTCPGGDNSWGVVTFASSTYVSFGQGTCMQLGGNVQSIYVAKCYCSLWSTCTGNAGKDVFVGGMMMCEKPKGVGEFDKEPKFISCGGMN